MDVRRKGLLVILDGLGDRPNPQLAGLTPLEAAQTPHLDELVRSGLCGLMDPLFQGVPVGTHTGTAVLLGLARADVMHLTRGPVEAAGIGLSVAPGDVLIRCNFATLEPLREGGWRIVDRRAGRIGERTAELAAALDALDLGVTGVSATLRPATQHRAVLRLSGAGLSPAIGDTDPGSHQGQAGVLQSLPINPSDAAATFTAEVLNRFTHLAYTRLRDHRVNRQRLEQGLLPANGVICRGAGVATEYRSLVQRLGLSAAVVAGESTVIGLAKLLGYTTLVLPGFTSLPDTDLQAKVAAAQAALRRHDLVFLHIKGPDICSHDRDPVAKRDLLERVDAALAPFLDQDLVIGVTGDHSTDSHTGRHTGDPVPALLCAPLGRRDGCRVFAEGACMTGGLGRLSGSGFFTSLLDAMNLLPNYKPPLRDYFHPS
jgi:2,3-bisphosphoglycerate-independent phosphoglycerate mutase